MMCVRVSDNQLIINRRMRTHRPCVPILGILIMSFGGGLFFKADDADAGEAVLGQVAVERGGVEYYFAGLG